MGDMAPLSSVFTLTANQLKNIIFFALRQRRTLAHTHAREMKWVAHSVDFFRPTTRQNANRNEQRRINRPNRTDGKM